MTLIFVNHLDEKVIYLLNNQTYLTLFPNFYLLFPVQILAAIFVCY